MPPLDLQAMMKMMIPPTPTTSADGSAPPVPDLMSMLGPLMSSLNTNPASETDAGDLKVEDVVD
jgi:hypothetical protein